MDALKVVLPDGEGDDYEYATMELEYSRSGSEKSTKTILSFADCHGWYGCDVKIKDRAGTVHGPFEADGVELTFHGAYEAWDLIDMFRKIVKHHDMQQLLLRGTKGQ